MRLFNYLWTTLMSKKTTKGAGATQSKKQYTISGGGVLYKSSESYLNSKRGMDYVKAVGAMRSKVKKTA